MCHRGLRGIFRKVSDVSQFAEAIRNKLVIEIAGFKLSEVQERRLAAAFVQYTHPTIA